MNNHQLRDLLDDLVARYNTPDFIAADPISVPHRFSKPQDIEIAGLFAALFAWGRRDIAISKANQLMQLMGNAPHDFVLHHPAHDLRPIAQFVHRTFNGTDALYFVDFLQRFYARHNSLEDAFYHPDGIEQGLNQFSQLFFDCDYAPARTRKHVSSPARGSACKRLNMYLRWMVRRDDAGVDFGIWQKISPAVLVCPCDVHVLLAARQLNLINDLKNNWTNAVRLTDRLRQLDPQDPVKYDFALFALSLFEKRDLARLTGRGGS